MNGKKTDMDEDDEILDELDENLNLSGYTSAQWSSILETRYAEVRGLLNR